MPLAVDTSVGLKWVLNEPDSPLAEAFVRTELDLLVPDFWLHEATNVLWLQVRRRRLTPDEAREGLGLLRAIVEPASTANMRLHDAALDIGIAINHPTYDTLYVAFAIVTGASAVVTADADFARAVRTHPDPTVAAMTMTLEDWARSRNLGP